MVSIIRKSATTAAAVLAFAAIGAILPAQATTAGASAVPRADRLVFIRLMEANEVGEDAVEQEPAEDTTDAAAEAADQQQEAQEQATEQAQEAAEQAAEQTREAAEEAAQQQREQPAATTTTERDDSSGGDGDGGHDGGSDVL
jgi:hypothetical protein